jgi:hypothetical protein
MDATGKAAEDAAKARAKEIAARKDEISLVRQQEAVSLENDVFDPKQPDVPLVLDEVEDLGVAVKGDDMVIIRTMHDIEDMTFGVGNNYSFKAGVKYRVPLSLARHLARLGYTWNV